MHYRAKFHQDQSIHCGLIMIFVIFQDGGHLPSWIFKMWKFYWLKGFKGSRCITVPCHQNRSIRWKDTAIFLFFKKAVFLICLWLTWTTHEEYLVVFITTQNLAAINVVVLIIWKFEYLACLAKKAYTRPKTKVLGAIWPPKWDTISTKTKKAHPCTRPHCLSHHMWKSAEWSDL